MTARDEIQDEGGFPACVREQLERILRSRIFAKAPSLSSFLRYVVERGLTEGAEPPNEYSLGVDVFRRGESFDPTVDTIVRVQARRLRSKLQQYYASEGHTDPLVVEVPRGQYSAVFRTARASCHSTKPRVLSDFSRTGERSEEDPAEGGWPNCFRLSLPCSSFVGRDREMAEVKDLLRSEHVRLLTVTGAGGSGKTRLALHAAAELGDEFPGGVYLVPLSSLTDVRTVSSTIGQALGLRHTGGSPLADALQVHLELSINHPTLLLLDNFEQVAEAAQLVTAMLSSSPHLKVFVTSRSALRLTGEQEYAILPLPPPDPNQPAEPEELCRNPAVTLFLHRARAVNPAFTIREDNAQAVAEICARLDGLPLAIELAAARLKIVTPAAMLARFGNTLDLLTCGQRDLPARQQTLRTTIDWSHELLTAGEQTLFRRLAVFPTGCTLESAEAVTNARRDLALTVLDGISSLVDKNLLQRNDQESGETRFTMLQTIREYALEQLTASGEGEFTRRAHAAYCIVLAEEGAAQITEEHRARWLALWDAEHDNLRDALDWLIERDNGEWALRLGIALFAFWQRREHLAEGRERLKAVLDLKSASAPTRQRARAAWYASIFADQQGDYTRALRLQQETLRIFCELNDRRGIAAHCGYIGVELRRAGNMTGARRYLQQCLAGCRELGDRPATAAALSNLAEFVGAQGEHALARSLFQEALAIFREIGNTTAVGWSMNHLGDIAFEEGDFAEARRLYEEGYEVFQSISNEWGVARSLTDLGRLASEQGDQNTAESLFGQALKTFAGLRHLRGVARTLEGLAFVAIRRDAPERALTLFSAAEGLRQKVGSPKRPDERRDLEGVLESVWRSRDSGIASAIRAQGLRMPLERIIRFALEGPRMAETMSVRS